MRPYKMRVVAPFELCVVYAFVDIYIDSQVDGVLDWMVSFGEDLSIVAKRGDGLEHHKFW